VAFWIRLYEIDPMALGEATTNHSGTAIARAAKVIIVSSVMFTFISYWRTAAVVLCDLASTAYYIGGIVEQAIGPAAPWLILAVMIFSYAVRSVYIESCSLFVRGGVYRVVKEAMGGFLAKLSVSALMFDYVLTGPISGVSAGQYIAGLCLDMLGHLRPELGVAEGPMRDQIKNWCAVVIATLITLYFLRQNLIGIHESSEKAFWIMVLTTVMAAVLIVWCGLTLLVGGPKNRVPIEPNFQTKMNYDKNEVVDPLGALGRSRLAPLLRGAEVIETGPGAVTISTVQGQRETLRVSPQAQVTLNHQAVTLSDLKPGTTIDYQKDDQGAVAKIEASTRSPIRWWSWIGAIGILIAFGHSILAMSGEETLAQVYREVESPKLPNFKKAAFIVFIYSLLLTSLVSFLAVLLIPDDVRMPLYHDNLIGGLAMNVIGPQLARLVLQAFVVTVGFFILAGAVNTALIGSNGVLCRVADDGVMPEWFLRPHPRYGTSYRILYLISLLQLIAIFYSQGDVNGLGELYAFGVVWSFVFKALAMVVLRFRDRSPREFKVPLNIQIRGVEVPIGLSIIFLILLCTAVVNLFTKEVATISGGAFTLVFLCTFIATEHYHERKRLGRQHEHLEQFNQQAAESITPAGLGLTKPYRMLVAIRSPQNLYMLDKTLLETDPTTTDVVVMTAKLTPPGDSSMGQPGVDEYDRHLLTAVVQHAEKRGKQVKPLIVPTNNPLYAVIRTARDLSVQELTMGASNKYTADEQLDQIAFYWFNLHDGQPTPLTVRLLGRERDVHLDLAGGNRIPKISEREARSVAELRAAGVGVDHVLLVHENTSDSSDLFQAVLTMLDLKVELGLLAVGKNGAATANGGSPLQHDLEQADKLGRKVKMHALEQGTITDAISRLVREEHYDLLVIGLASEPNAMQELLGDTRSFLRQAPCRVFLAAPQAIPQEPEQ
jgi:amino acid transporter